MLGSTLIACGAVEEGLERLAECVSLAVAEEFDETASGWAYCHTVAACAEVGDFGRAEQWCDVLHSWSATWRARQFFGICRTAYGEVLATRGDWDEAEEELRSAMDDLESTRPALAGLPPYASGACGCAGKEDEARAFFERALPCPRRWSPSGSSISRAATQRPRPKPPSAFCATSRRKASSTDSRRSSCSPARTLPAAITPGPELAAQVGARRRAPRHFVHARPRRTGPGRRPDGRGRP